MTEVPEFLKGDLARFLHGWASDNAAGVGGYRNFEEDRRTVSRLTGIDDLELLNELMAAYERRHPVRHCWWVAENVDGSDFLAE